MSKLLSKTDISLRKQPQFHPTPQVNTARSKNLRGQPAEGKSRESDIVRVLLGSSVQRQQGFTDQLERCRRHPRENSIHDLRVSTRRLIAIIDLIGTILPDAALPKVRRELKRLLGALSELRDIQVQIISVEDLVKEFPMLSLFHALLMVSEKRMLRRARAEPMSISTELIVRELVKAKNKLEGLLTDPLTCNAAGSVAFGTLAKTFMRASTLKPEASTGKTDRIHRFRVAFKRFRYTVEALAPVLPGVTPEMFKSMNAYQVRMGNIQDIDVLIANVRAHAKSHRRTDPLQFRQLIEHLINRRKELIEQFVASADELSDFWQNIIEPELRGVRR